VDGATKRRSDEATKGDSHPVLRRFIASSLAIGLLCFAGCTNGIPTLPGALPFNFHVIEDGQSYRSAQPTAEGLQAAIEQLGIATVVNLRGENPDDAWWRQERAVCDEMGVTLLNIRMSAQELPSPEVLLSLYDAFINAEYPILIHCQAGADRTGAAAAIWRMVVLGDSRAEASAELSPMYFHFEEYTPAMDLLVEVFEPDRDWIANVYDPDSY
jgi:protein tyrosine/serine phosphatase